LQEVEKIGELRRISAIPWDKDMGGLVEMILERSKNPPAMLFDKVPGSRQDGNSLQPDRHAAAFGHRHGHRSQAG
jgi:hypothetical protein